jgi:hypothetical protein
MKVRLRLSLILISCLLFITPNSLSSSEGVQGRRETLMENSENKAEIREPVVAGSFYTADPKALSKQIKEFLF